MKETLPVHHKVMNKEENALRFDKSKASLFLLKQLSSNGKGVVDAVASKAGKLMKMDNSKALMLLLEKIEAIQKETVDAIARKIDKCAKFDKSKIVPMLFLAVCLFSHSQGFCAADKVDGLDSVTKNVMDIVFGAGIKKSILVLAAGWGLFQAVSSGSFKPLLLWGGIGLAIAYVPKLIDIIANVG